MSDRLSAMVAVGMIIALGVGAASARSFGSGKSPPAAMQRFDEHLMRPSEGGGARMETLWIFDADFSDLVGDNAGWTTYDCSGTLAQSNYWHHDTLRIDGFTHLGDSTWWCGTYDECWCQPRGYGNDWYQVLERHFDEHVGMGGTSLVLEYDQRYAIERNYDFGYVDLCSPTQGDTWRTVVTVDNPGEGYSSGTSQDWDSTDPDGPGHMVVDITDYIDGEFDLRFRFESDWGWSSQDHFDNPPESSFKDGAWQLDNITLLVDGTPVFYDDAESGDPWVHNDLETTGQTGVTFWRGRYGIDFVTGRDFMCEDRPVGTWMYAAVDPFTSTMVDDQSSWLVSPPIDVSGAERLVSSWDYWVDLPWFSYDYFDIKVAPNDVYDCVTDPGGFVDAGGGGIHYGGPLWGVRYSNWDEFAANDWLAIRWELWDWDWAEPTEPHRAGLFLNRQRVGIPSGDPGTHFEQKWWQWFNDWYVEQMDEALRDTAHISVTDRDGVASVTLLASKDAGQTWESYACRHESEQSEWWYAPPPVNQMTQGSEIWYYFEAIDGVGTVTVYPYDAPDAVFEMSILPINASVSDPGLLLVDKYGGDLRPLASWHLEYYYVEMLEILGYEWDVYDVESRSGNVLWYGPDTMAHKYYDTQIWAFGSKRSCTLSDEDQEGLIVWLNEAGEGKERNLLLAGDGIGYDLIEKGHETQSFYGTWLASYYLSDAVGAVTVDSIPTLRERAGGWTFLDHDDGECVLRGGCPWLRYFDVVQPYPAIPGTEIVADYVKLDSSTEPAGVAYTHQMLGYQTVNLGFSMASMRDVASPAGYVETGVEDRVNLMANIMAYFGRTPTGPGTGVVDGHRNELSHAYPNPFNPMTKIAYAVKDAGPVTIEVYNVAGRVVRTLLECEVKAGASGFVVWDGMNDGGERCASGVYFYRIAAPGFTESRKVVILK